MRDFHAFRRTDAGFISLTTIPTIDLQQQPINGIIIEATSSTPQGLGKQTVMLTDKVLFALSEIIDEYKKLQN